MDPAPAASPDPLPVRNPPALRTTPIALAATGPSADHGPGSACETTDSLRRR